MFGNLKDKILQKCSCNLGDEITNALATRYPDIAWTIGSNCYFMIEFRRVSFPLSHVFLIRSIAYMTEELTVSNS